MRLRNLTALLFLATVSLYEYTYFFNHDIFVTEAQSYDQNSIVAIISESPIITYSPTKDSKPIFVGSAILINKGLGNYDVLTNKHVIKYSSKFQVMTADGKLHRATISKKIENLDAAILTFKSETHYSVAKVKNTSNYAGTISINGWIQSDVDDGLSCYKLGAKVNSLIICQKLVEGSFKGFVNSDMGYDVAYDAETSYGMSGGMVTNSRGDFIAMHGRRGKGISVVNILKELN